MTKRIVIYLFVFLVVFLCIFFLVYLSQSSVVFNMLRPAKQFPKGDVNLHLYGNEQVSVNKVLVRMYYCMPAAAFVPAGPARNATPARSDAAASGEHSVAGGRDFIIEDWQNTFAEAAAEVSRFYQLQFSYNMKMDFKIYPQIIYLEHNSDYFADFIAQDFVEELAQEHSQSQSIKALVGEVESKTKDEKEWELTAQGPGDSYAVNLFVLALDINALRAEGRIILGLNDEGNNSLVFSSGLVEDEFKDFYESIVAHEIGHGLGMPKFYGYSSDWIKSSGVMGGGLSRKLKDNYLKEQIKEEMID